MTASSLNLTEKVSVNINTSSLAAIDLLVDHGFFSNRSDFINQALREAICRQGPVISRISQQIGSQLRSAQWFMGLMVITPEEVDRLLADNKKISISGYGVLSISHDIPDEKLFAAVEKIEVKGRVACKDSVREHYRKHI